MRAVPQNIECQHSGSARGGQAYVFVQTPAHPAVWRPITPRTEEEPVLRGWFLSREGLFLLKENH